ncbi:MAG: hypothetical protein Q8M02_04100 [Candidatus Didemnitutus sp.]|nr:hypothetical protein [Candidatus Didemnitutus sp.]
MRHLQQSLPVWQRFVAMLGIGLVLSLGAFAASADLHEWLHGNEAAPHSESAHHDEGCVVLHWARGGATAWSIAPLVPVPVPQEAMIVLRHEHLEVAQSAQLRPPGRAPPAA